MKEPSFDRLMAAILVALVLSLSAQAEPTKTCVGVIDEFHAALLDVMKGATELGYEGRAAKLAPVIPEYFDISFMARKSVGSYWKQTDAETQQRLVDAFERFMVANYAGQFDGFSGQFFETLGEQPARMDTMLVKSRLVVPDGDDVELNYRMRQVNDTWKIVDVYLDGTVSELALRRSEFTSIVKRDDFEALFRAIDAKIAKLSAETDAT